MVLCRCLLMGGLLGCSIASADQAGYVDFDGQLIVGKRLWLENCEGCHGYGIAGAPIPMQVKDWKARVSKSKEELYTHAINGFFGPGDTHMPARGGNEQLTDNEVEMAVDYMVMLATHYLKIEQDDKK